MTVLQILSQKTTTAQPGLQVQLLGQAHVTYRGETVAACARPRLQSLLAYLALNPGTPMGRQQVACALWPESTDAQARTNLRRELHHLCRALPESDRFLKVDVHTVTWHRSERVTVDTAAFESALARADSGREPAAVRDALLTAVELYRGDLLPTCYESWVEEPRDRLRRTYQRALARLVDVLESQRAYARAVEYATRSLALDPLNEANYSTLMRLQALSGDTAGALRTYRRCVAALHEELGVSPGPELQAQHSRLRARAGTRRVRSPSVASLLVGRRDEWQISLGAWRDAAAGRPQLLAIEGEAGIGKTRLAEALLEWAAPQGISVARARAYAAEGRIAYAPISEWLRTEPFKSALSRLESVWLTQVARLLPELSLEYPDLTRHEVSGIAAQRHHLFEAVARAILLVPSPVMLLLDDLQWCDQETLEWLHFLLRYAPDAPILVVATIRSGETHDNPALLGLTNSLEQSSQVTFIRLGSLDEGETAELGVSMVGRPLTSEERSILFAETEGHPLFAVEMIRAGFPAEPMRADPSEKAVGRALPPKVQAVIAARLGQLSPGASAASQIAAAIGRSFRLDVLTAASGMDETTVIGALEELSQRHIVREQGDGYDFSHDRIREVAYASLGNAKRRFVHRRIANALEQASAGRLEETAAVLAAHYEQAQVADRAIDFYEKAAQAATRISAHEESARLLRRALALLDSLPESQERDRRELSLHMALCASVNAAHGYTVPELEKTFHRLRELGERLGDARAIAKSLHGFQSVYFVRGEISRSVELARRALEFAEREGLDEAFADGHFLLAGALLTAGELHEAVSHFDKVEPLVAPENLRPYVLGTDLLVFSKSWESHARWLLGHDDQAEICITKALERANRFEHSRSQALANAYAALLGQLRGDRLAASRHSDIAIKLCADHGIAYYGEWGTIFKGWILAEDRDPDAGVRQIRKGLKNLQLQGAGARRPYYLSLLALALNEGGRVQEARRTLDTAIDIATRAEERWWLPELLRLRGTVSPVREAGRFFERALDLARQVQSPPLRLRAAASLAQHENSPLRTP